MRRFILALLAVLATSQAVTGQNVLAIRAAGRKLLPLQAKLAPPEPGDWLAEHYEGGQTFDRYISFNPNRPTNQRTTIYIQPIGTFEKADEELLADTMEIMGYFFGVPIKTLEALPISLFPPGIRRESFRTGEQLMADYVLYDVVKPRRPKDAIAVLALTRCELWVGDGWHYVFGRASSYDRVGVWSLSRFGDPVENYPETLRRTVATATHETGHLLGLAHCTAFSCGMNGRNGLDETDRGRVAFCSECEQKIWWACKMDPVKRYEALVDFASRKGLEREAREWTAYLNAFKIKP